MKVKRTNFRIPQQLFDTVYRMPLWQKALVIVVTWTVPLVLFWFLFLSARIGEIDSISTKIPKLKQEIALLEIKSRQLPKLEKELKAMQDILKQAMKLLPEKEDIPSVLTEISSLGNEARLEFQAFKPGPEKKEKFYASIPVTLEFKGPFHNTVVFFDRVSRMARIVHIKDVSMGNAKESSQIWSQAMDKAGTASSSGSVQPSDKGSIESGDAGGETGGVQRGSNWIIQTKCTAATYRFLTPEEQKANKKKKKK